MDGRLLARAREEKENIRRRSVQEDRRRHQTVYDRVPALRRLDGEIAGLMTHAVSAALGESVDLEKVQHRSIELQAQRAELLVEHGWAMDWLDGAWECVHCKDTGYVQGQMCDCLRALYEQERAKELSVLLKLGDETFGSFDVNLYDSRMDEQSGISPRQQMEIVFGVCYDYAIHFGKNSMNLLFQGGTGLGKTFLSACIARVVSQRGFSVVYETAVAALGAFERERFSRGEGEAAEGADAVRRLTGCDLLILDDLGTELVTEFSRSALYTLINTRLLGGKKTVISTNLSLSQLEHRYTPQILSRLEGEYQTLLFVGRDIRRLKKERGLA